MPGVTHESVRARDCVRASTNRMMQAKSKEGFEACVAEFEMSFEERFPVFVQYFRKIWLGRKDL